ncbi:MAG: DNA glycosylase AlkZ-like family protein, partial [Actinomycetota bacterium]
LLSHADRTRVISDDDRKGISTRNQVVPGTVLVDGFVRGMWSITRQRGAATLVIELFKRLSKKHTSALSAEGARLLAFAAEEAESRDIRFVPPG